MKTFTFALIFLFSMNVYGQSTLNGTINHSSGTRSYQLYIPAVYNGTQAVPLVLNLHGYGSNNTQQMFYGDFKAIADTANFLIVAPQGLNDNTGTAHWNANWGTGVDDLSFLSDLIDTIASNYNINTNRIYSTGMSNGGFMSFTLAGQLSSKITAVASVTGTMSVLAIPANTVVNPMPIMQIHGTADPTVNYNGDQYFLSVDSVLSYWVAHNNCNPTPIITSVPDNDPNDGCTAELYEYLGGDLGSEVLHYKITGGGHTWPGAPVNIGVTNHDFNASIEIWKFFSRYEKSGLTGNQELENESWVQMLTPNPVSQNLKLGFSGKEEVKLELLDVNGKLVYQTIVRGSVNVPMENLNTGLYFVRCSSKAQKTVSLKVVKNA